MRASVADSKGKNAMIIGGWQKCTLIDFPGKIATILFTQGCDFRCPFCHNGSLWPRNMESVATWETIVKFLERRRGQLEGVVISGGEPTLHGDLPEILAQIHTLGFATKLDTNGHRPKILKNLLERNLLDFIAMDLKHLPDKYAEACGMEVDMDAILCSIEIIKQSTIDYEFRTTVVPGLHDLSDVPKFIPLVRGTRRFTLQNFMPTNAADKTLRARKPFPLKDLEQFKPIFEPVVEIFTIRG
jgi:pyruvate formate lyase activating enzyme